MNREPRSRLPLAGLLIIFVAPLATLMVVVPSLFAGSVQKVEKSVPAIISRLVPNPRPHDRSPGAGPSGLPPVAAVPKSPGTAPSPTAAAAAAPAAPPSPQPSPAVAPPAQPVLTPTTASKTNHGRRRRRRPHQPLDD